MNVPFVIVRVLISGNMLSLYTAMQRSPLISASRCKGKIPATASTKPGLVTAYSLLRFDYSFALTSPVAALVPVRSTIVAFPVDFKLT